MKHKIDKLFITDGTDSRGHQKGSVSVEASLVFPLFFFCIMMFLRLFLLIMTEISVAGTVCGLPSDLAAVSLSERALLKDYVTLPSLLCYPELFESLSDNGQIENLTIICLDTEDEDVSVTVTYDFPIQAPGLPGIRLKIRQSFLIHTFIGEYDPDSLADDDDDVDGDKVYITENGQVYHLKKTCTYIYMPVEGVAYSSISSKRNSSGSKYTPCEKCRNARNTGTVYITAYGTKYHYSAKCSALVRNVQEIGIDQVGDRRPCSKCGNQ